MPTQPAVLGTARLNNFRLNYLTADQAGDRPTHIRIILGGIDITRPDSPMRVLYKSMSIRDVIFDTPNTCAFTLYGPAAPTVGQPIEVWINSDAPTLLFGGEIQTVERTYKGRPTTVIHPVTAIDDTARANRKRPLQTYTNTSATTIATNLMTLYVPGFSTAGVEANLPAVSITFDGSEAGMKGCLTALAKLIGGYWYFENKTLYFFITPPGPSPDPIDETPGRLLHEPAITWAIDKSQVRTRVFGKGASTQISASIATSTDLVPVVNGEMFNPAGGQAISAITPDGAACRILTYTGVQLGGGGGLVGPGASPSAAPGLTLSAGAGIESGTHGYAITFTTAAGESLPGPVASIAVGPVAPPASAVVPGAAQAGGSVDAGTWQYGVTFVTASGETTGSPASVAVTTRTETTGFVAETPPPVSTAPPLTVTATTGGAMAPGLYYYRIEFVTTLGTTGWSEAGNYFGANLTAVGNAVRIAGLPPLPAGAWGKRIYRTVANSPDYLSAGAYREIMTLANNDPAWTDTQPDAILGSHTIPTTNTTGRTGTTTHYKTVPLTGIPIGPAVVTARRIYRSTPSGLYQLLTTIANNTATTYTDTTATSALGAAAPVVNTATANQVLVALPIGGATVTDRRLYRTAANQSSLKLLTGFGNNTTATWIDTNADAALGAAPPVTDTSGLVQPNGQVPAGSTSLILANPAPFNAAGGWAVVGNGEQVIRYTGTSASALTGIPASGPGAIVASISYNSTVTAAPALVGVTGVLEPVIRNAPIHVWVQRDDPAAEVYMAALDGHGDGVYEHIWSDERRSEASLRQVCDAQLALYSRPLTSVTYASRDLKTKSGKPVTITLTTPAIAETLTIQDVTISELGIKGLAPKFTVTASKAHTSLESVLRMLMRKADA